MAGMTTGEILDAMTILDSWYRQAALSIGAYRCYYWRIGQPPSTASRYPAPWYVDPAEYMAEQYHTARNTLFAVFAS